MIGDQMETSETLQALAVPVETEQEVDSSLYLAY